MRNNNYNNNKIKKKAQKRINSKKKWNNKKKIYIKIIKIWWLTKEIIIKVKMMKAFKRKIYKIN